MNVLRKNEVAQVVARLKSRKRYGAPLAKLNLIIFRLSCCCGLRCIELCGLTLGDVVASGPEPTIRIRKTNTKGRHLVSATNPEGKDLRQARKIPLNWDEGTRLDIEAWKRRRMLETGGDLSAPFIVNTRGKKLSKRSAQYKWARLMATALGPERGGQVSGIHSGRHTFCTTAVAAGIPIPTVMKASGHRSLSAFMIYLYPMLENVDGRLFSDGPSDSVGAVPTESLAAL